MIHTASGTIDGASLGRTLMHEHIFIVSHELYANHPEFASFDRTAEIPKAVDRLNRLHALGIDSIVDCTVMGLGAHPELICEVARQVPVRIIMSTGFYCLDTLPFNLSASVSPGEVDPLDTLFLHDIDHGFAGTGMRPGILKCATDHQGLTPDVDRVLRSIARVHLQRGLPITTHTSARHEVGLLQQDVFEQEGVPLDRIVIGHSGDTTDMGYLLRLIDRGSYLGMDRFGLDLRITGAARIETIVRLCARGYGSRIVLSHDACCFNDGVDIDKLGKGVENWNYEHIPKDIVPALLSQGVSQSLIDEMLVHTPRRILDIQ